MDSGLVEELVATGEVDAGVLERLGARLRPRRCERGMTLADLASATGVSASLLPRLESGLRRPTLDVPLALARVDRVTLDDLVVARPTGDPRVHPRTHAGSERLYVLTGHLRLRLGSRDLVLAAGEVAEPDTCTPHAFTNPADAPAELLMLVGPQGQRAHVRARPAAGGAGTSSA